MMFPLLSAGTRCFTRETGDFVKRVCAGRSLQRHFQGLAAAYRVTPGAISHVSWVVPDVEQESERLARLGCRLINTATSGPVSVAWHDGGPLFPHPVEVHQHNDVIAGMHARLCALRLNQNIEPAAAPA